MREGGVMGIVFELEGLESIIEKAERMYGNSDNAQDAFLIAYGQEILQEEQALVRVDTGETKESLKLSKVKNARSIKSIWIGDVDKKRGAVPYYLEYGVMRKGTLKKYPFMRPAVHRANERGKEKGIIAFKEVLNGH